tara:strand:+ start:9642 stop:12341 length:2700 start_codon:yes stop_codon:yes gene_type:complete
MSTIWIDVDTALASVPVNKFPLIDDTDFKTIEDAVVYNQAGLALFWNFTSTAGVTTVTAVTPTTAGDYDWTDFTTSGMYGLEIPATGGASANNDTEGFGHFTGSATGILPWAGPKIGFRAAALNNSLVDAGTTGLLAPTVAARTLDVTATGAAGIDWGNVENLTTSNSFTGTTINLVTTTTTNTDMLLATAIVSAGAITTLSGAVVNVDLVDTLTTYTGNTPQTGDGYLGATAHANLVSQYDTTGLTGDNFPSTQSQLDGIANVGSATHVAFTGETLTTPATTTGGSFTDTEELDGTYMYWDAVTGGFEAELTGNIGAGIPSGIKITGYLNGNNDALRVQQWDYQAGTPAWKTLGPWEGGASTNNKVLPYDAFIGMVGTGANLGNVRLRLYNDNGVTDTALSAANIYIDQVFVEFSASSGSTLNAVYFDSNASNTGTTSVDGTPGNPVSTESAVNTLLSNRGLAMVEVATDSTITFATTHNNEFWTGEHWTLALGSQDIAGSHFRGASVSGVVTGTGTTQSFTNCIMNGTSYLKNTHILGSGISGTQTLVEAGDIFYDRCHSGIAGTSTWIFDFGAAIGTSNLNWRNGSGGIQLEAMGDTGTDTASIEGRGQIIEGTCTGGIVAVRGLFTTSGITNLTLSDDALYNVSQITASVPTAAAVTTAVWSDTLTTYTDGMAGKRLKGLSAVPTYEGLVNDVSATTTSVVTTLTGFGDSFFNDALLNIELSTDNYQGKPVATYTSLTGVFTVDEPFTTAPADGLRVAVIVTHIHPITQIQAGLATEVKQDVIDGNVDLILEDTADMQPIIGTGSPFESAVKGNVVGTVGSGSTTTSIVSSSVTPSGTDADQFKGKIMTFTDDTTTAALRGQATDITANTGVAAPTFTVTALTASAVSGDTFTLT